MANATKTNDDSYDFLDDSDDDDDLLLQPQWGLTLNKNKKPNSSHQQDATTVMTITQEEQHASSSKETTTSTVSSSSPTHLYQNVEQMEKKAQTAASHYATLKRQEWLFQIQTTRHLRFYKQNTKKQSHYYPCFVWDSPDATTGYDILEAPSSASGNNNNNNNHTDQQQKIIKFLGTKSTDKGRLQRVHCKSLIPFDTKERPNVWNDEIMNVYAKQLEKKQPKEFKENPVALRTELLVLEFLVQALMEAEQQQQQTRRDDSVSPPPSPDRPPSPVPPPPDHLDDDYDGPSLATSCATAKQSPTSNSRPYQCIRKIRAGDVIDYYPPHAVASLPNLQRALVLECHPGDHDVAVVLNDSTVLPRDHNVQLVFRRVRGSLVPVHCKFSNLRDMQLDKSLNGTFAASSKAKVLGNFMKQAKKEALQTLQSGMNDDDSDGENGGGSNGVTKANEEEDTATKPSSKGKSGGTENAAPNGSVSTKRTTATTTETDQQQQLKHSAAPADPNHLSSPKRALHHQLQEIAVRRQRRRIDQSELDVREQHLTLALQLCDLSCDLERLSEDWNVSVSRLRTYLQGDPNRFLTITVQHNLNVKFKELLETLSLTTPC